MFGKGERGEFGSQEPQPLGVEPDLQATAAWDHYMEVRDRTYKEVYDLWIDPEVTSPTIRQRAVTVLTAPEDVRLPFAAPEHPSVDRLLRMTEKVGDKDTWSLRERLRDKPVGLAEEVAAGVLYWLDDADQKFGLDRDSASSYLRVIQELLPIVSEDTADKLFEYLPVNDIEPAWDVERASGYGPAQRLLRDKDMPAKYKESVLDRWLDIATDELEGRRAPREEWESAPKKLAAFLSSLAYSEGHIDRATVAKIVTFMESKTPEGDGYVDVGAIQRISEYLEDDDLRYSLVKRHLLVPDQEDVGFLIHNERDLAFTDWLRAESMARGDTERFLAFAEPRLQRYQQEQAQRRQQQLAEEQAHFGLRSLGKPPEDQAT